VPSAAIRLPDIELTSGLPGDSGLASARKEPNVLDYIEVGDYVVVPIRHRGVGKTSGAPAEIEVAHVYEFRGDQIARFDEYDSLEEALEAVSLRE
jgi:ketosteroid isomerase-like protein